MSKKINMGKVSLWLIIIMVGAFVIAGSILAVRGIRGTFNVGTGGPDQNIDTEKSFSSDGIGAININTVSEYINIIPSDTNEIKAHFYGNVSGTSAVPEMVAEQNGSTLSVRIEHKAVIGVNIGWSNLKLDVYVPQSYSKSLKADTVSADMEISSFKLDSLSYHSVSGSLKASDTTAADTRLDTTSGRMTVEGFGGNLSFQSVSGDLVAEYASFSNNIDMHTVSGSMRVNLPEKSEFSVSFSSTSGQFDSSFPLMTKGSNNKHRFEGSTGNGSNRISAQSVSGDFELNTK